MDSLRDEQERIRIQSDEIHARMKVKGQAEAEAKNMLRQLQTSIQENRARMKNCKKEAYECFFLFFSHLTPCDFISSFQIDDSRAAALKNAADNEKTIHQEIIRCSRSHYYH
jgi:hypothetical protein